MRGSGRQLLCLPPPRNVHVPENAIAAVHRHKGRLCARQTVQDLQMGLMMIVGGTGRRPRGLIRHDGWSVTVGGMRMRQGTGLVRSSSDSSFCTPTPSTNKGPDCTLYGSLLLVWWKSLSLWISKSLSIEGKKAIEDSRTLERLERTFGTGGGGSRTCGTGRGGRCSFFGLLASKTVNNRPLYRMLKDLYVSRTSALMLSLNGSVPARPRTRHAQGNPRG